MKRILSVQPVAERGGSDYCLLRMVRHLATAGWDCHIAMPGRSPLADEFAAAGATVHVIPMRRITRTGSLWYWMGYILHWPVAEARLAILAKRINPGVVHSNSLHSWYGWAVARILRLPHVWHAREIVVQSSLALRLEHWLCRHFAWRVIAVSGAVAAQLPGADVIVIHDVPDAEEFSPERAGGFRARVAIGDGVRLIGAAGRIDTWKGFDIALDAVASIGTNRPDVQMVIAGGPVEGKEEYARGLASRAAALDNVHWLGERNDISDLLADLDAFMLPSTEPEPFSTVLAEALASGVPVAATNHGGSPEMLADVPPGHSILVPPGNARALADALTRLVPSGFSSAAERRSRKPMGPTTLMTFDELFEKARTAIDSR